MPTIIFIRHADATSADNLNDFDRPLSPRGIRQAQNTALLLKQHNITPTSVISSNALRAQQTTTQILNTLNSNITPTCLPLLYNSYTTNQLLNAIAQHAHGDTLLLVAHNPDITYRVANLCLQPLPAAFPTAGLLVLSFPTDSWDTLAPRSATITLSNFL